mmetsp:Transcript_26651/g.89226  ORF Transcript_26651/g.89226 Transcript_26651/m.89226 type:complete len:254 (+) Transcript_26651:975-1736(+)
MRGPSRGGRLRALLRAVTVALRAQIRPLPEAHCAVRRARRKEERALAPLRGVHHAPVPAQRARRGPRRRVPEMHRAVLRPANHAQAAGPKGGADKVGRGVLVALVGGDHLARAHVEEAVRVVPGAHKHRVRHGGECHGGHLPQALSRERLDAEAAPHVPDAHPRVLGPTDHEVPRLVEGRGGDRAQVPRERALEPAPCREVVHVELAVVAPGDEEAPCGGDGGGVHRGAGALADHVPAGDGELPHVEEVGLPD